MNEELENFETIVDAEVAILNEQSKLLKEQAKKLDDSYMGVDVRSVYVILNKVTNAINNRYHHLMLYYSGDNIQPNEYPAQFEGDNIYFDDKIVFGNNDEFESYIQVYDAVKGHIIENESDEDIKLFYQEL